MTRVRTPKATPPEEKARIKREKQGEASKRARAKRKGQHEGAAAQVARLERENFMHGIKYRALENQLRYMDRPTLSEVWVLVWVRDGALWKGDGWNAERDNPYSEAREPTFVKGNFVGVFSTLELAKSEAERLREESYGQQPVSPLTWGKPTEWVIPYLWRGERALEADDKELGRVWAVSNKRVHYLR